MAYRDRQRYKKTYSHYRPKPIAFPPTTVTVVSGSSSGSAGGSLLTFNSIADLAAYDVSTNSTNEGELSYIRTVRDYFKFVVDNSITSDGIESATSTGLAAGRWLRLFQCGNHWQKQSNWYINAGTGTDEASGTLLNPLRTHSEFSRRVLIPSTVSPIDNTIAVTLIANNTSSIEAKYPIYVKFAGGDITYNGNVQYTSISANFTSNLDWDGINSKNVLPIITSSVAADQTYIGERLNGHASSLVNCGWVYSVSGSTYSVSVNDATALMNPSDPLYLTLNPMLTFLGSNGTAYIESAGAGFLEFNDIRFNPANITEINDFEQQNAIGFYRCNFSGSTIINSNYAYFEACKFSQNVEVMGTDVWFSKCMFDVDRASPLHFIQNYSTKSTFEECTFYSKSINLFESSNVKTIRCGFSSSKLSFYHNTTAQIGHIAMAGPIWETSGIASSGYNYYVRGWSDVSIMYDEIDKLHGTIGIKNIDETLQINPTDLPFNDFGRNIKFTPMTGSDYV